MGEDPGAFRMLMRLNEFSNRHLILIGDGYKYYADSISIPGKIAAIHDFSSHPNDFFSLIRIENFSIDLEVKQNILRKKNPGKESTAKGANIEEIAFKLSLGKGQGFRDGIINGACDPNLNRYSFATPCVLNIHLDVL